MAEKKKKISVENGVSTGLLALVLVDGREEEEDQRGKWFAENGVSTGLLALVLVDGREEEEEDQRGKWFAENGSRKMVRGKWFAENGVSTGLLALVLVDGREEEEDQRGKWFAENGSRKMVRGKWFAENGVSTGLLALVLVDGREEEEDQRGKWFATFQSLHFFTSDFALYFLILGVSTGLLALVLVDGREEEEDQRGKWALDAFSELFKARGLKKHLKKLNAPKHWMLPSHHLALIKPGNVFPLILILRNKLKYALTYCEVIAILMQRQVMVDGKVRTDKTYPSGFMGRFRLHSIKDEEAKFKLCKVRSVQFGQKGIPYLNIYDSRTIRHPDPLIKANDTIKLDLETNQIIDFIKFAVGNVVVLTGGRNTGRVGVIKNREKHKGSFEPIHIQAATWHEFATRMGNVFTIGKGTKPWMCPFPRARELSSALLRRHLSA
ncbi:hypothetical protein C4D60_Mb11t16160 [Musa balbisiana]|uniref:KOW domain-containing protein n=1 Tax=Musa balbisiana TaxID=52838 RepID=A0A4S8J4G8_MUSBA|nr:hypothetical protein C4D60_Mb11t16160 [Musa balbisiana]